MRDIIDAVKSYRPEGPHSSPGTGKSTHADKLKPGTRTMLRRELCDARQRITALEERLRAEGLEDV